MAIKEEVEVFLRCRLAERLELCTEKQREQFARIWPGHVPRFELESAIALCDRTIKKSVEDSR